MNEEDIIVFDGFGALEPRSFNELVEVRRQIAVSTAEKIAQNLMAASPEIVELVRHLRPEEKLEVVIDPETKRKLAQGLLEFQQSKGKMKAVIVDAKTKKIVQHLVVEPTKVLTGIDPVMMAANLQNYAMQQQMQQIAQDLQSIKEKLDAVVKGLHNDRVALYKTGQALYRTSRCIQSEILRDQMIAQSIAQLSTSSYQLMEETKDLVKSLSDYYNPTKRKFIGLKMDEVEQKINELNICFEEIHKSFYLQTGILYELGETQAMMDVLKSYAGFLEDTLSPDIAGMLYQYDDSDKELEGKWSMRSSKHPEQIYDMRKQYLENEKEGTPIAELKGCAVS